MSLKYYIQAQKQAELMKIETTLIHHTDELPGWSRPNLISSTKGPLRWSRPIFYFMPSKISYIQLLLNHIIIFNFIIVFNLNFCNFNFLNFIFSFLNVCNWLTFSFQTNLLTSSPVFTSSKTYQLYFSSIQMFLITWNSDLKKIY